MNLKTFAALAALFLLSCTVPPQHPDVSVAVTEVTQAIVTQSPERLLAAWMPEKLVETFGVTHEQQFIAAQQFIDQQRKMLIYDFGETPPTVLDVVKGYSGSLTVTIELNGAPSPKKLNMWRDDVTGKVYYAGRYPAHVSPNVLAAEGVLQGYQDRNDWIVHNYSSVTHRLTTAWFTSGNPDVGAAVYDLGIALAPSGSPPAFCNLTTSYCCNIYAEPDPHGGNGHTALENFSFLSGFSSSNVTMQCNSALSYCGVAMMTPNDGLSNCQMYNHGIALYQTNPDKPVCCFQNQFGTDIHWPTQSTGASDFPVCNSAVCPGW